MRLVVQLRRIELEKLRESRVEKIESSVRTEDGDAFLQRVERFALDACQCVEVRFQMEALSYIVEEIRDPLAGSD